MSIDELVRNCELQAHTHRHLFELLGAWALDDPDPVRQRWYSTAAHRHAWHADLWESRRPTIPGPPTSLPDQVFAPPPDEPDARFAWYRGTLDVLVGDTGLLADRFDPVLDPGSIRVTRLVSNDLRELVATTPG